MNEQELNATMSVIADPINNVYKINSRKDIEEIQRICRILLLLKNKAINTKCYQLKT